MRRKDTMMTEGSLLKHLLSFSIPVLLSDLFQITYNTVDAAIVGQYVGPDALAAVGIASPVISIALFFLIGLGLGTSVLLSRFFGAGDEESFRRETTTALEAGCVLSIVLAVAVILLAEPILRLCNTPETLLSQTGSYLRIVAVGLIFSGFYNMLSGVAKSVGNTRIHLVCIICASVCNALLDWLFVACFGMGVEGAAWATVISQALNCLLFILILWAKEPLARIDWHALAPDLGLLKKTLSFAVPSAIQQAGVYIGKLAVQMQVNLLQDYDISAFSAVNRIDDYAIIPGRDTASGIMVAVAQNKGANQPDRMLKSLRTGLMIAVVYGICISLIVFLLPAGLMKIFVSADQTKVIESGTRYLRLMGLFYFMPNITNALQGYMRGIGKIKLTMYVTYSQMALRVILSALLIGSMGLDGIAVGCCGGWVLMIVWEGILIWHWKRTNRLIQ